MLARVKWFNNGKGYGFIEMDGEEDIFVHYCNITKNGYKTLKDGQLVEFDLVKSEKGNKAINIRPIKEEQTIE